MTSEVGDIIMALVIGWLIASPLIIWAVVIALGALYHQRVLKPTLRAIYKAAKAKKIHVSSHPPAPELKCPLANATLELNGKGDEPDEAKMKAIQDKLRSGY